MRYGITTRVEKSKKITIVNFMECDLDKLFEYLWIVKCDRFDNQSITLHLILIILFKTVVPPNQS